MELLNEYTELKKTIDYHMDRYYNQDEPEISDYEYKDLNVIDDDFVITISSSV